MDEEDFHPASGVHTIAIGENDQCVCRCHRTKLVGFLPIGCADTPPHLVVDFHLQWSPAAEQPLDEQRLHAVGG